LAAEHVLLPLRRSRVEVAGVRSPLLEAGPEAASEAVVFVHGNPGSSEDWAELIGRAGVFARAVAWDQPGFGKASKPARFAYTVEGYAAHLAAVLERLGIERAHLVLHDFGGPWGLAWAAQHPEAFASVALINTGVLVDYRWHYLARIWRTPLLGELFMATTTRPGFRLLLKHGNPRGLPAAFVERMYADFDAGTKRAVLRLYRATDNPAAQARLLSEALRPLDRPALVVWGAADPYIPVEQAERQRQTFPRAEIEILPESGHWPFADDPERVEARVASFLSSVVGARAEQEVVEDG
jgi:pimeloyl-ACP methyl ester carboxylesterase